MENLVRLAGNDVIETWGGKHQGEPHVFHHDRQVQDQRSKIVFDFLRSWGYAAAFGDVMAASMAQFHEPGCEAAQPPKHPSPTELAMRACEIVDAAWNELKHRGWIIEQPPFDECK